EYSQQACDGERPWLDEDAACSCVQVVRDERRRLTAIQDQRALPIEPGGNAGGDVDSKLGDHRHVAERPGNSVHVAPAREVLSGVESFKERPSRPRPYGEGGGD